MKANKSFRKIRDDPSGYTKVIGGLIAFLLMIIVAVLIFWETQGSIDSFDERVEYFTGYTLDGSNSSARSVELDNSPTGTSGTNVSCYNSTAGTATYPTFTISHKTVSFAAEASSEFSQINVTYTSNMGESEDGTSDMASTVFDLLPIIALAVVAAIIIGIIVGFGSGSRRL